MANRREELRAFLCCDGLRELDKKDSTGLYVRHEADGDWTLRARLENSYPDNEILPRCPFCGKKTPTVTYESKYEGPDRIAHCECRFGYLAQGRHEGTCLRTFPLAEQRKIIRKRLSERKKWVVGSRCYKCRRSDDNVIFAFQCAACTNTFCDLCTGATGSALTGIVRAFCPDCLEKLSPELKKRWYTEHEWSGPVIGYAATSPEFVKAARRELGLLIEAAP